MLIAITNYKKTAERHLQHIPHILSRTAHKYVALPSPSYCQVIELKVVFVVCEVCHCWICASIVFSIHSGAVWDIFSMMWFTWKHRL